MTAAAQGWELVAGLEVHCELDTVTKMFCGCRNAFGDPPNTNVCPVCLGLPGSLPVLNRRAVDYAVRIGTALRCDVRRSIFHRKNYFYPDMPKDFQISQYDEPINVAGVLDLPDGSRVGITRAHLEEDTGKTTHVGTSGRIHGADRALVDYNRAGVPLIEIVSEPDIRSAEQARAYVNELRAILVATRVSDARMEEGSLRVDANVSVRPVGSTDLGTRCEVKNLNSVRSLGRAIDHEVARQVVLLESGERVVQETRHWNEDEGRTHTLRSKEEAYDYRYFPEPDLVPVDPASLEGVFEALPVLPAERRTRLSELTGRAPAEVAVVVERGLDELVEAAVGAGADPVRAVTHAVHNMAAAGAGALDPQRFAALIGMETSGRLTATQSKAVLADLIAAGGNSDPEEIAAHRGFEVLDSAALDTAVAEVVAAHPAEAERMRAGDQKLIGFFVGKVMAATGGKADGKAVTAILRRGL